MMRRIRFFTLAAALAIAPTAQVAAQTKSLTMNDQERIRALYRKGAGEFAAGKYEEARTTLLDAWRIRQSYDVAAALGEAELELRRYRDAAEHLWFAVNNFAPVESALDLEAMKANLRQAKAHVAEVRVNVNATGVHVYANNVDLGAAPFADPIFLDPGDYKLEARRGSDVVARSARKFDENGSHTVDLVVPADAARPASSGSSAPTEEPNRPTEDSVTSGRTIAVVTGGSIAVVGVALGIGFGLASNAAEDDAKKYRSRFPNTACASGAAPAADCKGLADAVSRQDKDNTIAAVGWVLSAIGATAVGVALLWPHDDADRKRGSTPELSLGWQGNRLLFRGTF